MSHNVLGIFVLEEFMSVAKGRINHAKAILGPELHFQLANTSVLLVGAGGIGCELRGLACFENCVDELMVFQSYICSKKHRSHWLWEDYCARLRHH